MKTYYFIDYENVHSNGLAGAYALPGENSFYVFYTNKAYSFNLDSIKESAFLLVNFVCVPSGPESLDKHLIGYLGYLMGKSREEDRFVIVSRDRGYLPLAEFWNLATGIGDRVRVCPDLYAARRKEQAPVPESVPKSVPESVPENPVLQDAFRASVELGAAEPGSMAGVVLHSLESAPPAAPKKRKYRGNMTSALNTLLMKTLKDNDVSILQAGKVASLTIQQCKQGKSQWEIYRDYVKAFGYGDGLCYWRLVRDYVAEYRPQIIAEMAG